MIKVMIVARYTAEQMNAFVQDPEVLITREKHQDQFYGAFNAEVITSYFIRSLKYDFVVIAKFPDLESVHAAMEVSYASGAFQEGEFFLLADYEEAFSTVRKAHECIKAFTAPTEVELENA